MPANDKKLLRQKVRSLHPGAQDCAMQSSRICGRVLQWDAYRSAQVVAGYMPMPHEADIMPILMDVLASGKTLVLPRCGEKPLMHFHRVASMDELVAGAYGLMEPAPQLPIVAPGDIALMLVPLEALDRRGMRLGKGGGYYDHYMAACPGVKLGVALEHQWVEQLPCDSWDRPLDAAADQTDIHIFKQST